MAGNFSFGDYFKREAIELAWALLTNSVADGGYGLDPEKILGHRVSRRRRGRAAVAGDRGPADRADPAPRDGRQLLVDGHPRAVRAVVGDLLRPRARVRPRGRPVANEDRYLEIWNLVFMQNERGEGTSKEDFEILGPLPRKNIDTGMGVERDRAGAAGRAQRLRDRPAAAGHRPRRHPGAPRLRRRQPRRRCALPHHRRPQPHRGDPDRRRGQPRQRRPRLCAAPAAAPRHPLGQAARASTPRSSAT